MKIENHKMHKIFYLTINLFVKLNLKQKNITKEPSYFRERLDLY